MSQAPAWFDHGMERRWSLATLFAALAASAALAQVAWISFQSTSDSESTSDVLAWAMSLLGVAVVPLSLTAAGAVLLPPARRWMRWPMMGGVALASIGVAFGVAAGFLADDLPLNRQPSDIAMGIALTALALLVVLLAGVLFRLWARLPRLPRAVLALAMGVVGTGTLVSLIAALMPLWVASVVIVIWLLVAGRTRYGRTRIRRTQRMER